MFESLNRTCIIEKRVFRIILYIEINLVVSYQVKLEVSLYIISLQKKKKNTYIYIYISVKKTQ